MTLGTAYSSSIKILFLANVRTLLLTLAPKTLLLKKVCFHPLFKILPILLKQELILCQVTQS